MTASTLFEASTVSALIEFGVLIISVVALFMKINSNETKQKLLINENTIKIINLEKDILQLKTDYDKQIAEIKIQNYRYIEQFFKDNREDHQNIFEKFDEMSKEITTVGTLLKMHSGFKSPRDYGSTD